MSIQSLPDFPRNRVAIIANGSDGILLSNEALQIIKTSNQIIAVDGGINLCRQYKIVPDYLIGDLDSIEHPCNHPNVVILKRDKNIADLEAAILFAKKIHAVSTPILFNVLGGRADHHLNALYLLLKYPGSQLFSNGVLIRSLPNKSDLYISSPPYKDAIFNLCHKVILHSYCGTFHLPAGSVYNLGNYQSIIIKQGLPLFISTIETFFDFSKLSLNCFNLPFKSEYEEIHLLRPGDIRSFKSMPGLTFSLLPWCGFAQGVTTTGLRWELYEATLDYNFSSLSNIATGEWLTVSLRDGHLLCIIEKQIIRTEFLEGYSAFSTSMNAL